MLHKVTSDQHTRVYSDTYKNKKINQRNLIFNFSVRNIDDLYINNPNVSDFVS